MDDERAEENQQPEHVGVSKAKDLFCHYFLELNSELGVGNEMRMFAVICVCYLL